MKTRVRHSLQAGYALMLVMLFAGTGLLVLSGVMKWGSTKANLTQRNNQYGGTVAVAEAATEKVIGKMSQDYQKSGSAALDANLSSYAMLVPNSLENPIWAKYEFKDSSGNNGRIGVNKLAGWNFTNLASACVGLSGTAATYRVYSQARELDAVNNVPTALQQDVQFASIPIFQFGVFYAPDMEICPGSAFKVFGRVHGNGNIYCQPGGATLTFQSHVTAARKILLQKHPLDPVSRSPGTVTYLGNQISGVRTLNLPLGTNNTSAVLASLLDVPPAAESASSPLGQMRFYNKADLIILVSNNVGIAKSGAYNNFSVTIPWTNIADSIVVTNAGGGQGQGQGQGKGKGQNKNAVTNTVPSVVGTNGSFFNKRENKTVQATEIDISELITKYSYLKSVLGRDVKTIYVGDFRTQTSSTESGVRVVNGTNLPTYGLTIVTPNPLYIEADYNSPAATRGTTNTTGTVPAALVADAVTILSDNWDGPTYPTNTSGSLSARLATNTTVNAAILTGNVPTGGGYYSGGVENVLRFLEDWTGDTFTFNGSIVVLFPSRIATAPWGTTADVYVTPTRKFSFDGNFLNAAKLPASTPELRTVIRSQWQTVKAN